MRDAISALRFRSEGAMRGLVLAGGLALGAPLFGQCADAGACSLSGHPLRPERAVSLDVAYAEGGQAEELRHRSATLGLIWTFPAGTALRLQLPYASQSGRQGGTSGPGDALAILDVPLIRRGPDRLTLHGGVRLATGRSDADGLPQAYQSGLGSTDFLAGLTWSRGSFHLAGAYQQPSGRSDNRVTRLRRAPDALLRGGWTFRTSGPSLVLEGILIRRLGRSSVLESPGGPLVDLPGSDQTQLNLAGTLSLPLRPNLTWRIFAAAALLKRDVNPDGLTRSRSLSTGLAWSF